MRAFALLAALALIAAPALAQGPDLHERPGDFAAGDPAAPLVMVEYASTACPACGVWHREVWPMVRDEFVETGQVRFVFREVVTHPFAMLGFALARCAPEARYFDAIGGVFTRQEALFEAAANRDALWSELTAIASAAGLDEAGLDACYQNAEVINAINAASARASEDGVGATPSFAFNGVLVSARHAPGGGHRHLYHAGDAPLLIDGQPVEARLDSDTFRRIILHFLSGAASDGGDRGE